MSGQRLSTYVPTYGVLQIYVLDCPACTVAFGITTDMEERRRKDGKSFYCPNGHTMSWTPGKSDAQKLRDAEAREVALKDQLSAAVRDAEDTRVALLRDRQRFANGVCPCCNRSFENVARHMKGEHPDYDITKVKQRALSSFKCSCGRSFESLRGLRIHQGWNRSDNWDSPNASKWQAHLTAVTR